MPKWTSLVVIGRRAASRRRWRTRRVRSARTRADDLVRRFDGLEENRISDPAYGARGAPLASKLAAVTESDALRAEVTVRRGHELTSEACAIPALRVRLCCPEDPLG